MLHRPSEPSPSWLINQAFLSIWGAFAAGVSVVGFLLVSAPAHEEAAQTTSPSMVPQEAMPLLPFAENSDSNHCQVLLRFEGLHQSQAVGLPESVTMYRMGEGETLETRDLSANAGGWYFAPDVVPGTYHVTAVKADGSITATEPLVCAGDGAHIHRELSFSPQGVLVRGKLRGYDNKAPANAELLVQQEDASSGNLTGVAHVTIDEQGHFAFRAPAGRYKWVAVAPFHAGETQSIRLPARYEAKAKSVRLDVTLQWQPEVSGVVVDEKGAPVAGAEIFLGPMFDPKIGFSSVISGEDGSFSLPIIQEQANLVVASRTNDHFGVTNLPKVSDAHGVSDLRIVLKEGRTVRGYVQTQTGQTKPYAEVIYRIRSLGILASVQANADGAFRIRGLPKEDVELWPDKSALGAWGGAVATLQKDSVLLTYKAPAY